MRLRRLIPAVLCGLLGAGIVALPAQARQDDSTAKPQRQRRQRRQRRRAPSWERLQQRFDKDKDGKISAAEWKGPKEFFTRMDADKDGFVTKEEFAKSRNAGPGGFGGRRGFGGRGGFGPGMFLMMFLDQNNDGKISRDEFKQFFVKGDLNKDGNLTPDELDKLRPGFRRPGAPPAGVPQVGETAPDFTLRTLDGKSEVTLSEVSKERPTVLIFGSYT